MRRGVEGDKVDKGECLAQFRRLWKGKESGSRRKGMKEVRKKERPVSLSQV